MTCTLTLTFWGLGGYALSRQHLRLAGPLMIAILAVSMFPPVSLLPPLFQTFLNAGFLNTYRGPILAHTGLFLPFTVRMLSGYFATLPIEIEEAAKMDGMGYLRIFVAGAVPLTSLTGRGDDHEAAWTRNGLTNRFCEIRSKGRFSW